MTASELRAEVPAGFSGAVLVRRAGDVLMDEAFGLADRETGRPCLRETSFQMGSVSKQFTASAVLLLRDQNKLGLHQPLIDIWPDGPEAWRLLTPHRLLTHTCGLGNWPDYFASAYAADGSRTPVAGWFEPVSTQAVLDTIAARPRVKRRNFSYSSPGYVLLAAIVERISGVPYAEFLARSIFDPLGLQSTSVAKPAETAGPCAQGYSGSWRVPHSEVVVAYAIGCGDVWSTTSDLMRWYDSLSAGKLLSPSSLQLMFTPHLTVHKALRDQPALAYGYGWFIIDPGGAEIVCHPGDNAGFACCVADYRSDSAWVVVLSNDDRTDAYSLCLKLHDLALNE